MNHILHIPIQQTCLSDVHTNNYLSKGDNSE